MNARSWRSPNNPICCKWLTASSKVLMRFSRPKKSNGFFWCTENPADFLIVQIRVETKIKEENRPGRNSNPGRSLTASFSVNAFARSGKGLRQGFMIVRYTTKAGFCIYTLFWFKILSVFPSPGFEPGVCRSLLINMGRIPQKRDIPTTGGRVNQTTLRRGLNRSI
mgnify:CR=1 FL=1